MRPSAIATYEPATPVPSPAAETPGTVVRIHSSRTTTGPPALSS